MVTDGQPQPAVPQNAESHFAHTTWPGSLAPCVAVRRRGWQTFQARSLWARPVHPVHRDRRRGLGDAAVMVGAELGRTLRTQLIGPRCTVMEISGDWARMREIRGSGVVPVCPDRHVFWCADTIAADPVAAVRRVLTSNLAR